VTAPDAIWLGLDIGTQSARALAVTPDGDVLAVAAFPLASHRDGVRHEQAAGDWWEAAAAACRETLARIPAGAVQALAICGTSGTVVAVDAEGEPLGPGLMYDDSRARVEAERADRAGAAVWDQLGYAGMPASWALPKLLWLLRAHGREMRLAHQPDFVAARLVGHRVAADWSHALKTGYDLVADRWPQEVLDRLGVEAGVLPDVVPPGALLGSVGADGAEATGIPAGTPVRAGMTDGCAAQIAAAALTPGSWNSVLGTTLVLKGVTPEPLRDPLGAVYSHRLPGGDWLPGGASSVGAGALGAGRDLEALDRAASAHEPAGAIAYPLVSRGERFPFRAPDAEAFLLGEPADDGDRHAALLQGVAFTERLSYDYLDRLGAPVDGRLTLTGGGARSRYWCQLRADVLRRPVTVPRDAEPALGMAALAGAGVTGRPVAEVAAALAGGREEHGPRDGAAERFTEPYLRFVGELEQRGWLDGGVAEHARARAAA
jgi:sugar (pentulose or hexulose) kinase